MHVDKETTASNSIPGSVSKRPKLFPNQDALVYALRAHRRFGGPSWQPAADADLTASPHIKAESAVNRASIQQ